MSKEHEEQMTIESMPKWLAIWHTKSMRRAYDVVEIVKSHGILPYVQQAGDGILMILIPYTRYNIEFQQHIWEQMSSLPKYKKIKEVDSNEC